MRLRARRAVAVLAAAMLGIGFFVAIAGPWVIVPTETAWTIQGDWRVHFLGWHFFRHEPWHWPPGRIDGYLVPLGTSIGFTDSIPLLALALKPIASWLPASFQYLGAWFALCFALQGAFAVRLLRLWTDRLACQVLGALCFILLPTLLMRTLHPALCAHWLLLWALWLYLRPEPPDSPGPSGGVGSRAVAEAGALALLAGLIHPYLAVMTAGLLAALALRRARTRPAIGVATLAAAVGAVALGWWLSGLFILHSAESLTAEGAGTFSMNLLAMITPTGWSTILPELPLGAAGQAWEGFQYFGLGLLLIVAVALAARTRVTRVRPPLPAIWPLLLVVAVFAVYALGPRVTFGSAVLLDYGGTIADRSTIFRATGRFFWPAAYLILTLALGVIVRLRPRTAVLVLSAAVLLQIVDLRGEYAARRGQWQAILHAWQPTLASPAWARILPHYAHLTIYPPSYCGPPPADVESLAYLAGLHGMTFDGGLVARFDEARRQAACAAIDRQLLAGEVDDAHLYVGRPGQLDLLRELARQPVVCGTLDAVAVCATARSYAAWRDAARLQ